MGDKLRHCNNYPQYPVGRTLVSLLELNHVRALWVRIVLPNMWIWVDSKTSQFVLQAMMPQSMWKATFNKNISDEYFSHEREELIFNRSKNLCKIKGSSAFYFGQKQEEQA